MNANQITQIRTQLENLAQVDVEEHLTVSYPDQDLSGIKVGVFSGSEFFTSFKRMITQFENALEEEGALLPFSASSAESVGTSGG